MNTRAVFRISAVAFLISSHAPALAFADGLKERFLREAPTGWKSLRQSGEQIVGIAREERKDYTEGRATGIGSSEWSFKRNGEWLTWEETPTGDRSHCSAGGRNSSYVFTLDRKDRDQEWVVTLVSQDEAQRTLIRDIAITVGCLQYVEAPWSILARFPLDDLVAHPTFVIHSVSTPKKEGVPLVRVDFGAAVELVQLNKTTVNLRGGWIICDPTNSWGLREFEVQVGPPDRKIHGALEYGARGMLHKFTGKNEMGKNMHECTFELTHLERRGAPEAEFTLAAYGFKEPGTPERGHGWWFWAAIAGGGLLLAAIGLAWRKGRAK
jgi:hypothetical protein